MLTQLDNFSYNSTTSQGVVPRILYQTWKTYNVPPKMQTLRDKWLEMLPVEQGWSHPLLDDKDLRDLISNETPQYLSAYDSFTYQIERVDFSRYVMMYLGGIYADLDTYPTKQLDTFLASGKIVLGCEPQEHASVFGRETVVCNAFMISPPRQHFWIELMDYIVLNYEPKSNPVYTTGPMAITKFYEEHPKTFTNVWITDACTFYPMTAKLGVSSQCDLKDAYVVHVWHNSWSPSVWKNPTYFSAKTWLIAGLVIFFFIWARSYLKYR